MIRRGIVAIARSQSRCCASLDWLGRPLTRKIRQFSSTNCTNEESTLPLVDASAELSYATSNIRVDVDLQVWPNSDSNKSRGGHVVLGANGSGKTLLCRTLIRSAEHVGKNQLTGGLDGSDEGPNLISGSVSVHPRVESMNRNHRFMASVSFESHADLLSMDVSVHKALIPGGGNRLSTTAKFLIVRLGMYPLLTKPVNALSTGQIRRVLLVRSLVSKPEVLLLDNAFDGLDAEGRKGLHDIIERVLMGFKMDVLVQGIDARETARTQVLLLCHRAEEISEGFRTLSFLNNEKMHTEYRNGRSPNELICSIMNREEIPERPWEVSSPASDHDVLRFWHSDSRVDVKNVLVKAKDLHFSKENSTILSHLNWSVERGERWHLAGSNGTGKSTLSRLLVKASMGNDSKGTRGKLDVSTVNIGWVSTELHIHAARKWMNISVSEIFDIGPSALYFREKFGSDHSAKFDVNASMNVAKWLGLLEDGGEVAFLARRFSQFSQGEQKLLLIAAAISRRPQLLVLDEPCQGLDLINRGRVLSLVEKLCGLTDLSLIYITHHEDELVPSIRHRLVLEDGRVIYCGMRQ